MNIVVGYVQSNGDPARQAGEVHVLLARGCQAVRVEGAATPDRLFKPVLEAVCGFVGPGDELVAPDVTHLGSSPSAAEAFLTRLQGRGARVRLLDPGPLDDMDAGMSLEEPAPQTVSGRIDAGMVRALSARGYGPTQIARKLGVSRMTVWRKLAAQA